MRSKVRACLSQHTAVAQPAGDIHQQRGVRMRALPHCQRSYEVPEHRLVKLPVLILVRCQIILMTIARAYYSVYYYTKCALLNAGHATLKTKMCNIKLATQTIAHIIWCKTVADVLKINVLNTKTSSASGGIRPPDLPPGALPHGLPLGALPPDPGYRLALPRSPSVCVLFKNP